MRSTMLAKIKFSKVAVVVFLTVLIWVWTDLALDETYAVGGVTIALTDSSPQLWISFDGKRSMSVDNVMLKGPASRITNIKRKVENHAFNLLFPLDAEQEGLVASGKPLDVPAFLQRSAQLRDTGLVVESCEPAELSVSVVQLSERPLAVECYEESGVPLSVESIVEPATVNVLVPDDWPPAERAKVVLTRSEIEEAKKTPVRKTAHIVLADGQTRSSSSAVRIRIPPEEERLKTHRIPATIGYCLSENLQGRYKVELLNRTEVMDLIAIRATNEAKAAYEGQQDRPLTTLYILDRDAEKGQEEQRRPVVYNFPQEYVRKGDIVLNQAPVEVRFRLIPSPSAGNP